MREFLVNTANIKAPKWDSYRNNTVKTNKYSLITFLPLNLLVQFSKMANCYFLMLTLMEFIPVIYQPGGPLSMVTPLIFVVTVSMVKDMFEDYQRYKSDKEENNGLANCCQRSQTEFSDCRALDIQLGCFVKVKDDQNLPCDIILLGSTLPKGIAYVETKGLDGETNLKLK